MNFKNIIPLKISTNWSVDIGDAQEMAQSQEFVTCGPTQMTSAGWVPPRGHENGALIESIAGHWIMRMCIAKKILPGSVVKQAVQERVMAIEIQEGRKPGKKERREIQENVVLELLPRAFIKTETVGVWIDRQNQMVMVEASSSAKADAVITLLVRTFDGLGLNNINTQDSPGACMSIWLLAEEAPQAFDIDKEVELKSMSDDKATVKYGRHNLLLDEIKQHIRQGKVPIKLAMTWNGRISFTLTDALAIKKITALESVFEVADDDAGVDAFDGNMAIMTAELSAMIPDLIDALGGEVPFVTMTSPNQSDTERHEGGKEMAQSTPSFDNDLVTDGAGNDDAESQDF